MIAFLLIAGIVMLGLGLVSYISSKQAAHTSSDAATLSLLPETSNTKSQWEILFSHHDFDRHQHDPDAGSTFFSVNC